MKYLILAVLAISAQVAHGNENEQEKLLGAIAGGYLGSTIGAGDGKRAATVIGAIIGYRVGPEVLGSGREYKYTYNRPIAYRQADIYKLCDRENPYTKDSKLYWQYNRGCVQRLHEEMVYLEQQAYEQGYKGHQ